MPVIQSCSHAARSTRVLRLALIFTLASFAPVLLNAPDHAAYAAGGDSDNNKSSKKSILGKIKSTIKKRVPAPKDNPGSASSSSASNSSSTARKLVRNDASLNIVPRTAEDEALARANAERLERSARNNIPIRGYYQRGFDANLIQTNGEDAERGLPGEAPEPRSTPLTQDLLTLISAASEREREFAESGDRFPTTAQLDANQQLIRRGFLLLPSTDEALAMQRMADEIGKGSRLQDLDPEIRATVAGFLAKNEAAVTDARATFADEKSRSKLGSTKDAEQGEAVFGAADRNSFPVDANYGPPPVTGGDSDFRDLVYDAPPRTNFQPTDDNSESSEPPPAPDDEE